MVWCNHCAKNVPGFRPSDSGLACDLCGRILENFNFSDEVTFVKNAAGQSQASGNIVTSVQSGLSSSRERRKRIARDELRNLKDALGIGDERDDVIDMAAIFFEMAAEQNFTKGRKTELVQSSCLYLTCREKKIPFLLIDFSSYLRVSVYELGSVYLQLCEMFYLVDNGNYEELVDPSIFIPRFMNNLLKGAHNISKNVLDNVLGTATNIISSMKRDWMQTGRKPSGICGAAIYITALSHGIMCSRADIAKIVHMCEATITKRLNEFANTEAATLTVDELDKSEKILRDKTFTPRPNSDKGVVNCKHKDLKRFGFGLCKSCHDVFIKVSGGVVGGSDPPAFQRAEKERMEKAAREENEGGIEKSEGETDWDAEASDESGNLSDLDGDAEVDGCFLNEDEKLMTKISWELDNRVYVEEQAAKEAALKASNPGNAANCPEDARNLFEASKEAVAKSRKEKRQKRAEEAKNAPPPATAMEAVRGTVKRKRLSKINCYLLDDLFDNVTAEKSQKKPRTETVTEKKKEEHEIVEDEEDEEDEEAPYEMNTDEKFYEDEVEEEEDGYDFGLY
ncbi:Brf1 TBP-binding domain [Arabidopsis thaliana x Arabidopsis arenosa]|uniref:Brf1 TBP-binding domain n=1 Tax=Arabidopsis thaliana x Arabidopsis arenosa TaxID=1240361 RepID=A0A8T1ZJL2_9BRAS|nr:Brf1 TBP-binding domain [Arabidopsis thaliana x Arabidopsis arenosa]